MHIQSKATKGLYHSRIVGSQGWIFQHGEHRNSSKPHQYLYILLHHIHPFYCIHWYLYDSTRIIACNFTFRALCNKEWVYLFKIYLPHL